MATLVLSQIGSAIGGPAASIAGAFAGSAIDRSLLGSSRNRGARLDQLAVQGSGYGGTIPRIYGRMRVAGNIIWATPVRETRLQTGGKAGTGGSGYSVSLAIALSATPIINVGRVWADGKQVRSASGEFAVPVVMRVYTGSEAQDPDPLIEAAEGAGSAPAYRGMAYLVLEDLQLGEFAGRVPQFSFEVVSSIENLSVSSIVKDLAANVGIELDGAHSQTAGAVGYAAGQQGGIDDDLEALSLIEPFTIDGAASRPQLCLANVAPEAVIVAAGDLVIESPGSSMDRARSAATRLQKTAGEFSLIYADPARDFEPCVQRSTTGTSVAAISRERRAVPFALDASLAKQVAERELADAREAGDRSAVALPLRYAGLATGDHIRIDDNPQALRIAAADVESGSIQLSCMRKGAFRIRRSVGDPGRKLPTDVKRQGATSLFIADIPRLPSESADQPRLLIAAYGQSADWRQATIMMSTDGGISYAPVAVATSNAVTGITENVPGPGPIGRWDEINSIVVRLSSEGFHINDASAHDTLIGRNIALVGSELIGWKRAEEINSNSYKLSGLLRGLYGTERYVGSHLLAERFIAIDDQSLVNVQIPSQFIGEEVRFKAIGPSDVIADITPVLHKITAKNLMPLSPSHILTHVNEADDIMVTWIRRSRIGFSWPDGVDAPLGERSEAYEINIGDGITNIRSLVSQPQVTVSRAMQLGTFGSLPSSIVVTISQISELVGKGTETVATIKIR